MSYVVNPVKATCLHAAKNNYGIQKINDTCFGICAAFSGTNDIYSMDPACSQACVDLVEQRKHELFGVGSCDHQVPYRPVAWEQVPRYIPALMKAGLTKKDALTKCLDLCQSQNLLLSECQTHCIIDSDAVDEVIENYNDIIVNPDAEKKMKASFRSVKTTLQKEEKNHKPWIFAIILIFIIFCLIVYYRKN